MVVPTNSQLADVWEALRAVTIDQRSGHLPQDELAAAISGWLVGTGRTPAPISVIRTAIRRAGYSRNRETEEFIGLMFPWKHIRTAEAEARRIAAITQRNH